jgi:hypothetical protein
MEGGWTPLANGIILGDSAYPMKHWLIPPIIRNLNNPAQNRFLVLEYSKKNFRVSTIFV